MGACQAQVAQRRTRRTYDVVQDIIDSVHTVEDAPIVNKFRGFGKLILFGEHFVVHNQIPALVVAVAAVTTAEAYVSNAEWSTGLLVEDNRPAVEGYKAKKANEMIDATKRVLKFFGVEKRGVRVVLGGDLCAVSGVGASAANCVAVARAVAAALEIEDVTDELINKAGFEGEKAYHGSPSGIDNTCSTYGGLLKFHRTNDPSEPFFESQSLSSSCRIVYASTGITSSTVEVVEDVRLKKEKDPEWYASLEARYSKIHARAEKALLEGDWATVGMLAIENHNILIELGVSCDELNEMCSVAIKAGAVGAKLAGTGRGGLMLAICLTQAAQNDVFDALQSITKDVWATEIS